MKVAYIAGPYRGRSQIKIINWLQRQANIRRAAKVAKWAWREGYAVVCPHKNSGNFDGLNTDLVFLNGDVEILQRCDVMILAPGWERSEGTKGEIQVAFNTGIRICEVVIRNKQIYYYQLSKWEVEELLKEVESCH
jgi:hypothetical protein